MSKTLWWRYPRVSDYASALRESIEHSTGHGQPWGSVDEAVSALSVIAGDDHPASSGDVWTRNYALRTLRRIEKLAAGRG